MSALFIALLIVGILNMAGAIWYDKRWSASAAAILLALILVMAFRGAS